MTTEQNAMKNMPTVTVTAIMCADHDESLTSDHHNLDNFSSVTTAKAATSDVQFACA